MLAVSVGGIGVVLKPRVSAANHFLTLDLISKHRAAAIVTLNRQRALYLYQDLKNTFVLIISKIRDFVVFSADLATLTCLFALTAQAPVALSRPLPVWLWFNRYKLILYLWVVRKSVRV